MMINRWRQLNSPTKIPIGKVHVTISEVMNSHDSHMKLFKVNSKLIQSTHSIVGISYTKPLV